MSAADAVAIAEVAGATPEELLAQALEQGGLWQRASPHAGGRALLLLDFSHFESGSPVVVRRELVESLVDALADHGFGDVVLASSADSSSTWAENRDVLVLADLLGYSYRTPRGTPYEICDLAEELVPGGFPPGSVLAGSSLSRTWLEADLRIVVARCRTDQRDVVALAADTLLLALPQADKDYFYRLRLDAGEVLALLLGRAPPHFSIIDACGAAHGSGGRQAPLPIATRAVIAGADLLAVDCAAAAKMGADPSASPLLAHLLASKGCPPLSRVVGERRTFPGMKLPDPLLVAATRARDRSPTFARLLGPWLQRVDPTLFPFKSPLDSRTNAQIAARLGLLDDDPAARAWLAGVSFLFASMDEAVQRWRAAGDKDAIRRRVAGVSPATLACKSEDYAAMERELTDLAGWLDAQVARGRPLRWRTFARAVVFEYSREVAVPFEEFVGRVDVARTIQFMYDYLG
ncbi:MAG TPA: DUF362 domain-containing protein, partial [Myxococcales bacterium]|nr:DUF362 domain-containing protein [Myxococcales bacterium]